jgi:hypothetical protein
MEPKLLLIRLDILTETLSGQPAPLHCRDIKAVDGAYSALERWSKWGYTILGLGDQTAIVKQGKPLESGLQELTYTLYCFPLLDAIYFDAGFVGQLNRLDRSKKCYQIDRATQSDSLLSSALLSALYHYDATSGDTWVVSDSIKDEEVSSSHGVNFLAGDIWRICLDISTVNEPIAS